MKKTLIALAAVAAASASFAQSSATVYGIADMYVGRASMTVNGVTTAPPAANVAIGMLSGTGLANGGMSNSRLGFKAVEDLGAGMSATVVYETAVAPDTPAASTIGGRVATLALASGANSLTLGNQYTPALNYVACNSAIGCPNQDVSTANVTFRSTNAVSYGYNAAPFSIQLMNGFKEDGTGDTSNAGSYAAIGGTFTAGALVVGAALETNGSSTAGSTASNLTGLSATYDFGAFKLGGSTTSLRNAGNLDGSNRTGFGLQAAIPFGANAVHLAYGSNVASGAASTSTTTAYSALFSNSLSKTTNVYGFYTLYSSDANAALYTGGTANATITVMGIGARKSF